MSTKKPAVPKADVHVHGVSKLRGKLKAIGGSMWDDWNNILANQTVHTNLVEEFNSGKNQAAAPCGGRCSDRNCAP